MARPLRSRLTTRRFESPLANNGCALRPDANSIPPPLFVFGFPVSLSLSLSFFRSHSPLSVRSRVEMFLEESSCNQHVAYYIATLYPI